MIVLLCIAILSFFICVIFFFTSFFATLGHEKRDHYKKGEATFLGEVKRNESTLAGGPDNNLLSGDYVLLPPMVYPK